MRQVLEHNTRFYVDSQHGNDCDDNWGRTRGRAFKTPQYARDWVYANVDCSNHNVDFFLCAGSYPGWISAYPLLGLSHDYGEAWRGELNSDGSRAVTIHGNAEGAVHVAGNAQVYVYDVMADSTGPTFKAAYGGCLFLYNVYCLGAGGAILEAGPRGGNIDVNSPWVVSNTGNAGTALFNGWDGGSISVPLEATCYLLGNPNFTFSTLSVSERGRVQLRCAFVAGGARGRRWAIQNDGMILTGRDLDSYIPGDAPGSSLDGTGLRL